MSKLSKFVIFFRLINKRIITENIISKMIGKIMKNDPPTPKRETNKLTKKQQKKGNKVVDKNMTMWVMTYHK